MFSDMTPQRWLRTAAVVALKDLRTEARQGVAIASWLVLAPLAVLGLGLALDTRELTSGQLGPVLLWSAFALIGCFSAVRSFRNELHLGGLRGVAATGSPREAIFVGKFLGAAVPMVIAISVGLVLCFAIVSEPFSPLTLIAAGILGALAIAASATAAATLALRTARAGRLRAVVLGALIAIPAVWLASEATREAFAAADQAGWLGVLSLLGAYIVLVIGVAAVFFSRSFRRK